MREEKEEKEANINHTYKKIYGEREKANIIGISAPIGEHQESSDKKNSTTT